MFKAAAVFVWFNVINVWTLGLIVDVVLNAILGVAVVCWENDVLFNIPIGEAKLNVYDLPLPPAGTFKTI